MRTLLLAGAAALGLAAMPAAVGAQAGPSATTDSMTDKRPMTAQERADYDTWPPDRRAAYDRWAPDWQTYYWGLTPDQRTGWWVLNDEQRSQLYTMTPEQRTQAWNSIARQMSGDTAAAATTTARATSSATSAGTVSGNIRFVRNEVVQNISADVPPPNPPICERGMTDNCINAWEAGKRGRGVTRPLSYWPGTTATDAP